MLNKLDIYRVMGVEEVWVYRDSAFTIHLLDQANGRYVAGTSSRLLPGLDFGVLAKLVARPDVPQALRDFEKIVRGS